MFALIDCNNFYASCERLFRPDLRNKPIIVLSNNDGCVIARSNEAKALGIKMGEPYFKVKQCCQKNRVNVFSSNYTLYGDLSHRVMTLIQEAWPAVEIYSIDEAFLDLSTLPTTQHEAFCTDLQRYILKCTGIPTSVGIGQTKTLAKLANAVAKKWLKTPVANVSTHVDWLKKVDVSDIWGVGRQWSKRLHELGIHTAMDLKSADPVWIKQQFNVVLQRTAYELSGMPCMTLADVVPKQSIQCSRSFGTMQSSQLALSQAMSYHCARAFETLRKQNLTTQHISIFIQSNRFRQDLPQYNPSIGMTLTRPTDNLMQITKSALTCLKTIYKPDILYQKVGLCLTDLTSKSTQQLDLFEQLSETNNDKMERLMSLIDEANRRFGRHHLHLAAFGSPSHYSMRSDRKSPHYTTRWVDLCRVHAN